MDAKSLIAALDGLPLGEVIFKPRTGSTNDDAVQLAESGALDFSLVLADEQTAGRGRFQRRWLTPPGSALAFSIVLRPGPQASLLSRYTALGALAVCDAIQECSRLEAAIKWPNDVLLARRKVAGILAEASWQGDMLVSIVLGIGVNVSHASVPPPSELRYPATSIDDAAGKHIDRLGLLRLILTSILKWRQQTASEAFLQAWERRLAFRGEIVKLVQGGGLPLVEGRLLGLDEAGRLRLQDASGGEKTFASGDLRLQTATRLPRNP